MGGDPLVVQAWGSVAEGYSAAWGPRFQPFLDEALEAFEPGPGPLWIPGCGPGVEAEFLGARWAERDVIAVTAAKGTFKRIQLRVKGRAVHFLDLKVVYGNGETHDVKIRKLIPKGGETRAIDLPGKNRIIRKVELTYRSAAKKKNKGKKNAPGKAHVRLFGRR